MKYLPMLTNFVIAGLIIGLVLPLLPGIEFTGGVGTVLLVTSLSMVVDLVVLVFLFVVGAILAIFLLVKLDIETSVQLLRKVTRNNAFIAFHTVSILVGTIGLKVAVALVNGFSISGLAPAFVGAVIGTAAVFLVSRLRDPESWSTDRFNRSLDEKIAKFEEEIKSR